MKNEEQARLEILTGRKKKRKRKGEKKTLCFDKAACCVKERKEGRKEKGRKLSTTDRPLPLLLPLLLALFSLAVKRLVRSEASEASKLQTDLRRLIRLSDSIDTFANAASRHDDSTRKERGKGKKGKEGINFLVFFGLGEKREKKYLKMGRWAE